MAIGAVVAVVFIVLAVILAHLYVDWLWFGEVGLRTVFWRRLAIGAVVGRRLRAPCSSPSSTATS